MKRSKISGMDIEEYRHWMRDSLSDLSLDSNSNYNADTLDFAVSNMKDTHLTVPSIDTERYNYM